MTTLSANSTLSPDEAALVQSLGTGILYDALIMMVESMLYAVYMVLVFALLRLLFHTGPSSKARVALLLVAILMFLCSSALWALDVAALVLDIKAYWIDNLDLPLIDRAFISYDITTLFNWIQDILYSFEFVLGDCIVVWRACVLAQDIPKLWVVLTTLLMGSLASSLAFIGCIIHHEFPADTVESCTNTEIVALSFSIMTNIAATGSIGYIAWKHRKLLKASLADLPLRRSRIEMVLWSVVESGIVYAVLWVAQILYFVPATSTGEGAGAIAAVFIGTIGQQVAGLYPTVVIIIVHRGVSALNSAPVTRNTAIGSALHFASRSPRSQANYPTIVPEIDDPDVSDSQSMAQQASIVMAENQEKTFTQSGAVVEDRELV